MGRGANEEEPNFPVLDETEQARWRATKDAIDELAEAASAGDKEGMTAAVSAVRQVGSELDSSRLLNSLHVPKDAGEHEEALARMLQRIPDGWGRWIGCRAGWYPLIVKLDQDLAEIDPTYEINQVKEKFGTLRYYIELSDEARANPDAQQRADELIAEAERTSSTICEQCGQPGSLKQTVGYWYRTLCDSCTGERYIPAEI